MTDRYGFFGEAPGDERKYEQTDFARIFKMLARNGIWHPYAGQFQVQASVPEAMSVSVSTGFAFAEGHWYESDAIKTIPLATAHPTSPRIDRIVVQLDRLAARKFSVVALTGTPAAAPVAPALTRSSSIHELALADVLVPAGADKAGTIMDRRMDPDLCGFIEPWLVSGVSFFPMGPVAFNGQRVANIGTPTADTDAVTKKYVDDLAGGGGDTPTGEWGYVGFYAGDMIDMAGHMGHLTDFGASPNGRHVYGRGTPAQWLLCNGAEVKKTDYPDLWTALDDGVVGHYGSPVGGSNYFVLPKTTGNVIGYYHEQAHGFNVIGAINPTSELHFTPSSGAQNTPQWLTVGGKLIKT